jgi:hypothetical protein
MRTWKVMPSTVCEKRKPLGGDVHDAPDPGTSIRGNFEEPTRRADDGPTCGWLRRESCAGRCSRRDP